MMNGYVVQKCTRVHLFFAQKGQSIVKVVAHNFLGGRHLSEVRVIAIVLPLIKQWLENAFEQSMQEKCRAVNEYM